MSVEVETDEAGFLIATGRVLFWPLVLTTSLFFLWGFSYGLLDVLNKHFQEELDINKAKSTFLQFAYFAAYATVVWPAGRIMERIGYQNTVICGLLLFAIGAFLFIPSANALSFYLFVGSLFILASGLVVVETAASPYVTVLGSPEGADRRIAIAQCVFGLGAFFGPVVGGTMFFAAAPSMGAGLSAVKITYVATASVVLAFALLYGLRRLPQPMIVRTAEPGEATGPKERLSDFPHFKWAVLAQWLNVGAQVGVGALFINFATENWSDMKSEEAAYLLSVGMALFLAGRFISTAMLGKFSTNFVLATFAGMNVFFLMLAVLDMPKISTLALIGVLFGCGGTYSFIFALGVRGLGESRKRGAAALIFGVSGGAIIPPIMGFMADRAGTNYSYLVALACYLVVLTFALKLFALSPITRPEGEAAQV